MKWVAMCLLGAAIANGVTVCLAVCTKHSELESRYVREVYRHNGEWVVVDTVGDRWSVGRELSRGDVLVITHRESFLGRKTSTARN